MKIGTLFSGIGAPEQGASRVYGDALELVFACEYDKFARESFIVNYDIKEEHFHKDINELDATQYKDKVDCIIGGSPCQDFSIAGLRAGIDGNRGQLIWQYYRVIKETMPKYFIYENVKGMVSDKDGKTLADFLEVFRTLGYLCHYEVLNSKDYGVPQNRERLFIVGFLDESEYFSFCFAQKTSLLKTLRDVLEDDVDEKYYLSSKMIECLEKRKEVSKGYEFKPQDGNKIANCLTVKYGNRSTDTYIKEPQLKQIGILNIKGNDSIRRVYDVNGLSPCLTTMGGGNREPKVAINIKPSVRENFIRDYDKIIASDKPVFYSECSSGFQDNKVCITESACLRANNDNLFTLDKEYRIRKLTPRECFRLQDFPDSFKFVVSNSQLYKQAGNSMTVSVLEMIFRQLKSSDKRGDLFDFI